VKRLEQGDKGPEVERLQLLLNGHRSQPLLVDGHFGAKTLAAVLEFQEGADILVDGIVGSVTWAALGIAPEPVEVHRVGGRLGWAQIDCDKHGEGYDRTSLREDVAKHFTAMRDEAHEEGAVVTSSGGKRVLSSGGGKAQSTKSLHYVGLAHDLFVYSGMVDPETDPYVIVRDGTRHWRVFARCADDKGMPMTLDGCVHKTQKTKKVKGHFIDFTALMEKHGFARIGQRAGYPKIYGCAEWWHFQYTAHLVAGVTTFGSELLKLYTISQVKDSKPWQFRGAIWQQDWF